MQKELIILAILIGVALGIKLVFNGGLEGFREKKKPLYKYKKKEFFMTRNEQECFDALIRAVGDQYYIFPQAHLSSIIDNKVVGQNWKGVFGHINGKSVDVVLCDKVKISPVLAIELDDKTHERENRIIRDGEVERILSEAGLPLLRITHTTLITPELIHTSIL